MTDRERFIEDFRHKFYKAIGNWETEIYMTADEARNVLQELESQSATLEKLRTRRGSLGRWKPVNTMTPGGTPYYECGICGGSGHLHGAEYPKRKMICDVCGAVNIYPYEKAYEEGSSIWDEGDAGEGGLMPAT